MYKALLCSRYLRTRYIALASIVSVTLGVATLIVVNSVMTGFREEMYDRLHGILSDIVVESHSLEGIGDPEAVQEQIRSVLGPHLKGMTTTVHVPAMLAFQYRGQWMTRQVNLIGIDEATYADVSDFGKFLLHPDNRRQIDFMLRKNGYDSRLGDAGWEHRQMRVAYEQLVQKQFNVATEIPETDNAQDDMAMLVTQQDPFTQMGIATEVDEPDDPSKTHTGIVIGISVASVRQRNSTGEVVDYFLCKPGDDVKATFPKAGIPPDMTSEHFTVVDLYESKMSEYDSNFAFVPLSALQESRGMIEPLTGLGAVTAIQIKLKPGADLRVARDQLRDHFPSHTPYHIQTWQEMQGPLLSAVQLETTLLNILLFLIIAVAGFGILATFFMIVVEKTRDIGILKSLGAPSTGVMSIFLGYGLSLGAVGAGVGLVLGLMFVANINRIAHWLELITGREVFDPTVYYFQEIPTIVHPSTVAWVMVGAMLIAILASVLPAIRAARLHPVEALRYE